MAILLVVAHPDPASFNHAIAAEALSTLRRNGHEVICHDLYAEHFDPLLPAGELAREGRLDDLVERHCRELARAEGIVVVHPNWWGQPPAILVGWVDRVFRAGVAYRFLEGDAGEGVPVGLLAARAALVFNTSNTPAERELAAFGDPLETLWRNCIFGLCGVNNFRRRTFGVVVTSSLEERQVWLKEVEKSVKKLLDAFS